MAKFEEWRQGYINLFTRAKVLPERKAQAILTAKQLWGNRTRYEIVASPFGCPWWLVACVHSLESGANWTRHLHNGDPLTARTRQVPAGRPLIGTPPFTFEQSARDALALKAWDKVELWEMPRCLFELERYNGFGYGQHGVNSPYLWSFTDQYHGGRYVSDGKFDMNSVSEQCGAVAIIKSLAELGLLEAPTKVVAEIPLPPEPRLPPATPVTPKKTGWKWLWDFFK